MSASADAVTFQVHQVAPLADGIFHIGLMPERGTAPRHEAGQYLKLVMPDGTLKPLSIASPPEASMLELQVQAPMGDATSHPLIDHFRQCETVTCHLPFGACRLPPDPTPVLMIAGGTGIAPMRAMLAASIARGEARDLWLYWGVPSPDRLFLDAELAALSAAHPRVHYRPVIERAVPGWGGLVGLPHVAALAEHASLRPFAVHCSGSAPMARAVYRALRARGLLPEQFHCDWIDILRVRNQPF